jgi:hypothetical protein
VSDIITDEGAKGLCCGHCVGLDLGRALWLIHGNHGVGPFEQVVGVGLVYAKKARDDAYGHGLCEGGEQIEGGRREPVDGLIA